MNGSAMPNVNFTNVTQLRLGSMSDTSLLVRWTHASLTTLQEHARLLTRLDQAIGDGDHGDNMLRGFGKLAARSDELGLVSLDAALQMAGTTLIMSIGGASGPLFGSFFLGMGRTLSETPRPWGDPSNPGFEVFASAFGAGVQAVKARGKANQGEKTMLDVLVPVSDFLQVTRSDWTTFDFLNRLETTAKLAKDRTKALQATKGRASFLRERSVGHIDPGAMTSYLLIKTLCEETLREVAAL